MQAGFIVANRNGTQIDYNMDELFSARGAIDRLSLCYNPVDHDKPELITPKMAK